MLDISSDRDRGGKRQGLFESTLQTLLATSFLSRGGDVGELLRFGTVEAMIAHHRKGPMRARW